MSGSELAEGLGISLVLYSHQWKTLVEAGLIKRRKQGQTGYCSLDRDLLRECAGSPIR
jgi:DNA-binding transcriptional ArsR family regulator